MSKLRIVSRSIAPLADRKEAGRLLAGELSEYRGKKLVVLGIPRGGIVVACDLAAVLDAEIDVVLAHKLGAPGRGELAIGAVCEDGTVFLNQELVRELDVDNAYLRQEEVRQLTEMKHRSDLIRQVSPKVPLQGRTVVVTDDGVATGATIQAAIWAVRMEHPERLIAAVPVGPEETIRSLASDTDEMICLRMPPSFAAVGQFYRQFAPVEDSEVLRILRGGCNKHL